jgi:hypothetical protein
MVFNPQKIVMGAVSTVKDFDDHFQLIIQNAMAFNPPDNLVHKQALLLQKQGSTFIATAKRRILQKAATAAKPAETLPAKVGGRNASRGISLKGCSDGDSNQPLFSGNIQSTTPRGGSGPLDRFITDRKDKTVKLNRKDDFIPAYKDTQINDFKWKCGALIHLDSANDRAADIGVDPDDSIPEEEVVCAVCGNGDQWDVNQVNDFSSGWVLMPSDSHSAFINPCVFHTIGWHRQLVCFRLYTVMVATSR